MLVTSEEHLGRLVILTGVSWRWKGWNVVSLRRQVWVDPWSTHAAFGREAGHVYIESYVGDTEELSRDVMHFHKLIFKVIVTLPKPLP